jgi:hypothetical protein
MLGGLTQPGLRADYAPEVLVRMRLEGASSRSLASLQALDERIDVSINDSDQSAEHDARVRGDPCELSTAAMIMGDNAHVCDAMGRHSRRHGRTYLCFQEQPLDHWDRGAGIGLWFAPRGAWGGAL